MQKLWIAVANLLEVIPTTDRGKVILDAILTQMLGDINTEEETKETEFVARTVSIKEGAAKIAKTKIIPSGFDPNKIANYERKLEQLNIIYDELKSIGIGFLKPTERHGNFFWRLRWQGQHALLSLVGTEWAVSSLTNGKELIGVWQGFDPG